MKRSEPRVLLVSMPWASTTFPQLGVGLLVAGARRHGYNCRAWHANLSFAAHVGLDVFEFMSNEPELFPLAEHLFAVDVFGSERLDSDAFMQRFCGRTRSAIDSGIELSFDSLCGLRDYVVPSFLDECSDTILAQDVNVVGFSCVFNQALPSIALAHRLRRERPDLTILLGGGLMHGDMGPAYARAFRGVIDHVFTGEADEVFPRYLAAFTAKGSRRRAIRDIPGITVDGSVGARAEMVRAMDELPIPTFDEYYEERERLRAAGRAVGPNFNLPFESSRGCWWGEKHHCTFCGLNNEGMAFRSKSAARVTAELLELSQRYHMTSFSAADNILVRRGYTSLLPQLADLGLDLKLFYEIKANVSRDEVAALARAGVQWLVPGIESFADHPLALMRKGTTAIQNVQLLKWLQEFGVTGIYNVLVGFPGETDADFEQMITLIPRLYHLPPPSFGGGRANLAQVHRFSPFFDESESLGIVNKRAAWWYRHIIPPDVLPGEEYGYFFERDIPKDAALHRHWRRLNAVLAKWRVHNVQLWGELGAGYMCVWQHEGRDVSVKAMLRGDHARVMLLADSYTSRTKLRDDVQMSRPGAVVHVDTIVDELVDLGLMVEIGGRIVGTVPLRRKRSSAELKAWLERWSGATTHDDVAADAEATTTEADPRSPALTV